MWLESGQFWLSENPDEKFSKSWDSSLPRVATWVRLKDKKSDGREVLFANTHFDHRGVEARRRSAALLRTRLTKLAHPRIDWILSTSHFTANESLIDRTNDNARFPSDHFPVTAVLQWSK